MLLEHHSKVSNTLSTEMLTLLRFQCYEICYLVGFELRSLVSWVWLAAIRLRNPEFMTNPSLFLPNLVRFSCTSATVALMRILFIFITYEYTYIVSVLAIKAPYLHNSKEILIYESNRRQGTCGDVLKKIPAGNFSICSSSRCLVSVV